MLFTGFPSSPDWAHVKLTHEDIGDLLYGRYPAWIQLSAGSRRVRDGASNVRAAFTPGGGIDAKILAIEGAIAAGRTYPALILAAKTEADEHGIVEGHSRATAYFRALGGDAEVEMIAAYSSHLPAWRWY
jgi:hypothetical protein